MKLVLEYEIADDVTYREISLALQRAAAAFKKRPSKTFEVGDEQTLLDTDGDAVGEWRVTP